MDFFDPQKQKRHMIRLYIGYALIALALVLLTTILLYQAYGYGVDRNGKVIQNGLVFLSSTPDNADIYVNDKLYKSQTNTRMVLPAGQYKMKVQRDGYRTWQRVITVEGGSVERFDYPFLFPSKLTTTTTKEYGDGLGLVSQSPDRRWLLLGTNTANSFELYDLKAKTPTAETVTVPDEALGAGDTTAWQEISWADDNRHVVLRRNVHKDTTDSTEYILFDRSDPTKTQNLSQVLGFTPSTLELRKGDYDQYYAYDQANGTVFTASLKKPTPQLYLEHVLAFTVNEDTSLFVTAQDAPDGKVLIRMRKADDPAYTLRTAPANTPYLLDLAVYDGTPYVAAGAQSEGKVYVYEDPLAVLKRTTQNVPAPVQILKVDTPNYVTFSENARFVMAENNDHFAVYDAETDKGYSYQIKKQLDAGSTHAQWMDGYHLNVVSDGKVYVFDFDGANPQTLMAADPAFRSAFTPDYKYGYAINAQHALTATALRIKSDL